MSEQKQNEPGLTDFAQTMKREWDERARADAKWFINTVRRHQSEKEFDATGAEAVRGLLAELTLLAQGREPQTLRLLEIGCGIGRMTKHLAALFGEVHAVDVSGEMIARARRRLRALKHVHLYETNGVDLTALPSDFCDVAFSIYVFQHVPSQAVIAANIREAYRVLRPGGVFAFHTNGVTAEEFVGVAKDTWIGTSFPAAEIRRCARELSAQLVGIQGAGTTYCWATLRKPLPYTVGIERREPPPPRIELVARADDATISRIPTQGDRACAALLVTGLEREEVDANNLLVEIGALSLVPRYVGRVKPHFESAVRARGDGLGIEQLMHVEFDLPAEIEGGQTTVRVRLPGDVVSAPMEIELAVGGTVKPKIVTVRNTADFETDIRARGPKSLLRIYVEGLDETANNDNVWVKADGRLVRPGFAGFVAEMASYQVEAQLPTEVEPGVITLSVLVNGVESAGVPVEVKAA